MTMTIAKGATAGDLEKYHAKDDYYLKEGGTWFGTGAEALGLKTGEKIEKSEWQAVLRGQDPHIKEQLVEIKNGTDTEMRRAGTDLSFSLPKSISVAIAAGDKDLKGAHDRAVSAALNYIEAHYSHARSPDGFIVGKMVAARFDHATSRALDPQFHTHAVICNMVQTGDDRWRANAPPNLYKDQLLLGQIYHQALHTEITALGHEVVRTQPDPGKPDTGIFELKAIPQTVNDEMSKRSKEIEAQVETWKTEGTFTAVREAQLYEMANLKTRAGKAELSKEDIQQRWHSSFKAAGTTPEQVLADLTAAKRVNLEKTAQVPQQKIDSAEAVRQAIEYYTDKEAVVDRAKVMDTVCKISDGKHNIAELDKALTENTIYMGQNSGREFLTTEAMQSLELRNMEAVEGLTGTFQSSTSKAEVEAYLAGRGRTAETDLTSEQAKFQGAYQAGISAADQKKADLQAEGRSGDGGFRPGPEQKRHITNELAGSHGISITQGDAGTGKTSSIRMVEDFNRDVLLPSGREHYSINVAVSAAAARKLGEESGRPSFTVDKFFNLYNTGQIKIPEKAQVCLRLDEASFIDARKAETLMAITNDISVKGHQVKHAQIGDTKQLSGVQAGDTFRQFQNLAKNGKADYAHLTTVFRQRHNPELLKVVTEMQKEGGPQGPRVAEALNQLDKMGKVTEKSDPKEMLATATTFYMQTSNTPSLDPEKAAAGGKCSTSLMTTTNSDRLAVNQSIREARIAAGEIERGQTYTVMTSVDQRAVASAYKPGQEVYFTGYRDQVGKTQRWAAPLHTKGVVTANNPGSNNVQVKYQSLRNGVIKNVTKDLPAAELAIKTSVYEKAERDFAVGDVLVALKNNKELGIDNGNFLTVKQIEGNAFIVINAKGKEISLDIREYPHLDHGYASTVHKMQGDEREKPGVYMPVKTGAENEKTAVEKLAGMQMSSEQFNVWNTQLSDSDRNYSAQISVGGHVGTLSITTMTDQRTGDTCKAVEINFQDGQAIKKDETMRQQMRADGLYWIAESKTWATAISNERAMAIIEGGHPLKDTDYKTTMTTEIQSGKIQAVERHQGKSGAVVDTTAEFSRVGKISANAALVMVTRATHDLEIITNSKSGLQKAVLGEDLKTSNLHALKNDYKAGPSDNSSPPGSGPTGASDMPQGLQLSNDEKAIAQPQLPGTETLIREPSETKPPNAKIVREKEEIRETSLWTTSAERNGAPGVAVGGGTQVGKKGDISASSKNGLGMKTTHIATGGSKGLTASFSQNLGQLGSVVTSKFGCVTRPDGAKIYWRESGRYSQFGSQSHRVEKSGDVIRITDTKISKTGSVTGNVTGSTKTIYKDGRVEESQWQGKINRSGEMNINKSQTLRGEYSDQALADRHFGIKQEQQGLLNKITEIGTKFIDRIFGDGGKNLKEEKTAPENAQIIGKNSGQEEGHLQSVEKLQEQNLGTEAGKEQERGIQGQGDKAEQALEPEKVDTEQEQQGPGQEKVESEQPKNKIDGHETAIPKIDTDPTAENKLVTDQEQQKAEESKTGKDEEQLVEEKIQEIKEQLTSSQQPDIPGKVLPQVQEQGQALNSESLSDKIDNLEQQIKSAPELSEPQKSELEVKIDRLEEQIRDTDNRDKFEDGTFLQDDNRHGLEAESGKETMEETGIKDQEVETQNQQPQNDKYFDMEL